MPNLTLGVPVRHLDAEDLDLGVIATAQDPARAASTPDAPAITASDPQVQEIIRLLDTYSGVILSGPPGTSKTYLAHAVAVVLSDADDSRMSFVQFHPSYQYEDFMQGYKPMKAGGFESTLGVFMALCERANRKLGQRHVIVIDEMSRGDAARVFGEALTYVERSKRGMKFALPSGDMVSVPPNVDIIATMNPLDRGIDELDAAFERRFAKHTLPPSADLLDERLIENGMDDDLRQKVIAWFKDINGQGPHAQIGHAYFWTSTTAEDLQDLWKYQLQYHTERAFRYDETTGERLTRKWDAMFPMPPMVSASGAGVGQDEEPDEDTPQSQDDGENSDGDLA